MITEEMLSLLRCSSCKSGRLLVRPTRQDANRNTISGELRCELCGLSFPIANGIPDLIPYSALQGERWEVWKTHLRGFEARRKRRADRPSAEQADRWKKTHAAFFKFAQIPDGRLLDVGCGPGGLRFNLREAVTYFGLDPLPALPDGLPFPFVRAIAEYIPFPSGSFASILVNSALDHFCDIETFFLEAARVLGRDGRVFIQQSVHQVRDPVSVAKAVTHRLRDTVDGLRFRAQEHVAAPKHISEFSQLSLLENASRYFRVQSIAEFNPTWYSPTKFFVSMRPLG